MGANIVNVSCVMGKKISLLIANQSPIGWAGNVLKISVGLSFDLLALTMSIFVF
jgi:hypothetical protein